MSKADASRTVVRTLSILERLAEGKEYGLTELAQLLGMHKSTVYRFVNTLCELGYARQHGDERYSATLRLFELGTSVIENTQLWQHAHETMEALSTNIGETLHLAIVEQNRLVYIHKVESNRSLRVSMSSRIGHSAYFHSTALGKTILAYASEELRRSLLEANPLVPQTPNTITSLENLIRNLRQIRENGFALDNEENELGVRCIAVPVCQDADEQCLAALSISAPAVRFPDELVSDYFGRLNVASKAIARGISARALKFPAQGAYHAS